MKPIKNRVFCLGCGRAKMLFKTQAKAERFLFFNGNEIPVPEGCRLRVYYCEACGGWHITHKQCNPHFGNYYRDVINAFHRVHKKVYISQID